ncbi:AAA family ATPase [Porticoccaceae bacterium]|nr:AAA family ATPase [Porticoccaceae bacterium]
MSIYLQHFGLKREPFSIVPDPGFLYPSNHHRQAVAHLKYGLDREGGFILLTGEVGTGKTTLTRTILKRMPAHIRVAYVLNSKLNVTDLLASICDELAIELPSDLAETRGLSFSKICIDALNKDLLKAHAEGKKTLIVIEEAQNLSPDILETLRLLSNLETNTHKLLHILLVGQPELLDTLAQKELRQLNQRVVSRFHLLPLDKDDVANYVNHRLHRAGAKGALFDRACIAVLFRLTGGVPRLINLVCQHSLLATYSTGAKTVSPTLVKEAAVEILGSRNATNDSNKPFIILMALLVLSAVLMIGFGQRGDVVEPSLVAVEPLADREPSAHRGPSAGKEPSADREPLAGKEPSAVKEPSANRKPPVDVAPAATSQTAVSPFTSLFKLWSVDASEIYSEEEFAAQAIDNRLRAEKLTLAQVDDLAKINRPGVIWIKPTSGNSGLKAIMLVGLDSTSVFLRGASGEITLSREQFLSSWSGSYLYLWQPPKSFNVLQVGVRNPQAVSWLQDRLAIVDQRSERIITGGRYTGAIAEKVVNFQAQQGLKADGVVGRETIIRLNQLANLQIPRLIREGL